MIYSIDSELLDTILDSIATATKALNKAIKTENKAIELAESGRLMNEQQAQEYLSRDADTLLYYRKNGLPYYKCGRDVWYRKADIDKWLASGYVNRRSK